jgi:hypothetical protein
MKYTKWPKYIPNGNKIHLSLQDTLKFTQIWIFGFKIYHLAALPTLAVIGCVKLQGSAKMPPCLHYLKLILLSPFQDEQFEQVSSCQMMR